MRKQVNIRLQAPKARMQRIKSNIRQRKQKLILKGYNLEQCELLNSENVNYPQKGLNQKLKNRQAAQKSRQEKKKYIIYIENQIQLLQLQLDKRKYCEKCHQEINTQNLLFQDNQSNTHANGDNENDVHDPKYEQIEDESSSFMRISSTNDQSSIGIYLFICMIALGIFCMGARMGETVTKFQPIKRDLQQAFIVKDNMPQSQIDHEQHEYSTHMKSTYSTMGLPISIPENYSNSLIPIQQARSQNFHSNKLYYESIINSFQTQRIDSEDRNLRSKLSLINHNKSLLFCSHPMIYKSKNKANEGILTAFIDIFVKGAEIINIFSEHSHPHIDSNKIQLHGVYKISASVQEIQQIEQIGNSKFIY